MTSASACRPRLVGRPRGIMPAPRGVRAWGLLADLQVHNPRSTTAGSAQQSLRLIDGRAAASSPSFRPANKNARTITRCEHVSRGGESRDYRANFPRELHVVSQSGLPFVPFLFLFFSRHSRASNRTRERLLAAPLSRRVSCQFVISDSGRARARAHTPRSYPRERSKRRATRNPHLASTLITAARFIPELSIMNHVASSIPQILVHAKCVKREKRIDVICQLRVCACLAFPNIRSQLLVGLPDIRPIVNVSNRQKK